MSKMTANDARGEVGGGVKEISEQTGIERRVIIDWMRNQSIHHMVSRRVTQAKSGRQVTLKWRFSVTMSFDDLTQFCFK